MTPNEWPIGEVRLKENLCVESSQDSRLRSVDMTLSFVELLLSAASGPSLKNFLYQLHIF